jgi:23S rRNA (adenine2503-C2)-methyltransferase
MSDNLFGKTLSELKLIAESLDLPGYTAGQISDWLYKKNISSIDEMTNLSKSARQALNDRYYIDISPPVKEEISRDGTRKYLFSVKEGKYIEAVYIPEQKRRTLCISTQIGCRMGCIFCITGKQGFQGNLDTGEILNQVKSREEDNSISNIVYMGMGEPLNNPDPVMKSLEILTSSYGYSMSPRRITVSTIGIMPALNRFIEKSECSLAISLQSPFADERRYLIPPEKKYPIKQIVETLRKYNIRGQRRLSFEYIMFKQFNDTDAHVTELAILLKGIKCRINLIRFHSFEGCVLESSDEQTIRNFKDKLNRKGLFTTVRVSRGQDISAACGMLSTRALNKGRIPA